jgi:predicted DsbA family dithiol-disulfide isomerase
VIKIEVWADIVCPWCYIGKRRLEAALAAFDQPVSVEWRSFQLDPSTPVGDPQMVIDWLGAKPGFTPDRVREMFAHVTELAAAEGLALDFDRARTANTFDAHRVLHFAKAHGRQAELQERIMHAHFTEGADVADRAVLAGLAGSVGLDEAAARQALADGAYESDVEKDIAQARAYGISGVPFFVLNQQVGLSGAQPVEVFAKALRKVSSTAATAAS